MKLFNLDCWIAYKTSSHLMSLQAITGIGFDKEAAVSLLAHINVEMDKIVAEVEPQLPPRPMNKGEVEWWLLPAKPWNKDGTHSALMHKWCETRGGTLVGDRDVLVEGVVYPLSSKGQTKTHTTMHLANQKDLKEWLLESGWIPTLWNFKRDAKGKPERDQDGNIVTTTPKMQEQGKLCPNLEQMQGELIKPVVKWLSYRNRRSVVEGWLGNERLAYDGRLSASAPLIASTFRQKHSVVVNVPKAEDGVLLGKEMRSLFIAKREGYKFVGYDASALEARIEGHYASRYEGGKEYANDLINGDIHLKTAATVFAQYVGHLVGTEKYNKDNPIVKPWRAKSKNIKYGISYGAQPPKIASMLGVPLGEGKNIYNAFWESAKPLALFKEKLTEYWETTGGKQYVLGIDGRKIRTRSKHSLVNAVFQSCGAIVMDYSALFMDKWLGGVGLDSDGYPCYHYKGHRIYRVSYHHDELGWEVPEELAKGFVTLGNRSIIKAGEHLKLRVPLDAAGKVGDNWKDVH